MWSRRESGLPGFIEGLLRLGKLAAEKTAGLTGHLGEVIRAGLRRLRGQSNKAPEVTAAGGFPHGPWTNQAGSAPTRPLLSL